MLLSNSQTKKSLVRAEPESLSTVEKHHLLLRCKKACKISVTYPDEDDSINKEEHTILYTIVTLFFRKVP